MQIILASSSPRRKELLSRFIKDFDIYPADVDETLIPDADMRSEAMRLARMKALALGSTSGLIIAADTIVSIDGKLLAKPRDTADAVRMLLLLSAKKHQVVTGVTLYSESIALDETFSVVTDVYFTEISPLMAGWYVATGEPLDKAGAYGVQGKGSIFVERIDGDYDNVVGLPIGELMRRLSKIVL